MSANVGFSPSPILQFFDNNGHPNAGGTLLTQVGGVNYPTYQDSKGVTPLPNPIPLNSRGEVSNSSGVSCQLFLVDGVAYTFTLYDALGNQLNQATSVEATNLGNDFVCTSVAGTNSITATVPGLIQQLTNGMRFVLIAGGLSTGAVTLDLTPSGGSAIGALKVFYADGTTQANYGALQGGVTYCLTYNSALDSGAGGFQLDAPSRFVPYFWVGKIGSIGVGPSASDDIPFYTAVVYAGGSIETSGGRSHVNLAATATVSGIAPSAFDGEMVIEGVDNQGYSMKMNVINAYIESQSGNSGTLANVSLFQTSGLLGGGKTFTQLKHYGAGQLPSGTDTVGTEYGFFCEPLSAGSTKWGVYIQSDQSYFGGETFFGGSNHNIGSPEIMMNFPGSTGSGYNSNDSNGAAGAQHLLFYSNSTQVGGITTNSSTTTYATSSDARLKENVVPLADSGAIIDALSPVAFDWKHDKSKGVGFIAQDLHKVVPEAVVEGDANPTLSPGDKGFKQWQRDDSKLVPYLVTEVKSLRARLAKAGIA